MGLEQGVQINSVGHGLVAAIPGMQGVARIEFSFQACRLRGLSDHRVELATAAYRAIDLLAQLVLVHMVMVIRLSRGVPGSAPSNGVSVALCPRNALAVSGDQR